MKKLHEALMARMTASEGTSNQTFTFMRLLVVEDEPKLAAIIQKGLEAKGHAVDVIGDGAEALTRIQVHHGDYDLVVLDLMLPSKSGTEICKEIREAGITTPILILTARTETEHKVELLLAGADDYLTKPFSFDELLARIQAILRRPSEALPAVLVAGDIELDTVGHTVRRAGEEVPLTLKEFRLLEYFMRHPNQVINREDFLTHLWDFNYEAFSNVVDVHIKNLRQKLDTKGAPSVFETIRGIGYRLRT
ncbi:MAG TPA: response regulator transcription factor [Candidatus Paceibacterota bacterium]|nr:response regulator transcription factor [Candidatus Paceibacterota bacterium]